MNQGLNNLNQFHGLTQAQYEQIQAMIKSQQQVLPFFTGSSEYLQNLGRMNLFPDLVNLSTNQMGFKDLFNQLSIPNQNFQSENSQANYQKMIQSLQLNSLLGQSLMLNFPYNQVNLQNKLPNNASNPICVDDDEPIQQSRKCHNPQCSNKGDRKVKSKKQEYLYFCEKCLRLYNKGNFCDFCEQVYSNGTYDQDEVGWIQCDQCQKWNHLQCEAKNRNSNIQNEPETTPYYCLSCSKQVKKQSQQQARQQNRVKNEDRETYKQYRQEFEGGREKNITFLATKDNKVQFTFRLNLLEDEIKTDLESLRNSGKKIKKQIQQYSASMQQQSVSQQHLQSVPQLSPVQSKSNLQLNEEKNSESQLGNSRLRTRKQKYKVNYRDLGGEY